MKLRFLEQGETVTHLWRKGAVAEVPDDVAEQFVKDGIAENAVPEQAVLPKRETAVKAKGKPSALGRKKPAARNTANSDD